MATGRLSEDIPVTTADEIGELTTSFNAMRRSLTETQQALQRSEEESRTIIESAPNGMLMVDAAGTITLVNSETEALFRYRREELIGQSVEMLVPKDVRGAHVSMRNHFMSQPHARSMGAGRDLFADAGRHDSAFAAGGQTGRYYHHIGREPES